MSSKHLSIGSQQPPKVDGLLRLYSMEYCPYAQRARLVLLAKNIPHDIVNLNLINKPEWHFKLHPEGKVPALDTGSEVVVESLDIANYLDAKYPENPLYPAAPEARKKDEDLIQKIGPLTDTFAQCLLSSDEKPLEEWAQLFLEKLEVFETELVQRGTTFFGGDKPGMVDYMLWPWGERAGTVAIKLGKTLPFEEHHITNLRKWRKAMRAQPIVDQIYHGPEKFWKVVLFKLKKVEPDYDNV